VGFANGLNGDQVGSSLAPVDPLLGSLAVDGGSVPTHALLSGSSAVDAGDDFVAPPTDQRRFPRVAVSDIGAFEINATHPLPSTLALLSVVSRKTHGSAGVFDLPLAMSGNPTVEGRSGGAGGTYTLVFSFATPLVHIGNAVLANGAGTISAARPGSTPNEYIIELTGVADAQSVTISLANVNDLLGNALANVSVPMAVLLGDSNGDRIVNSGDVQQTRNRSGQGTSAANFGTDYNLDGTINSGDATIVRSRSGQFIP
jgi:hypothetical protein